MMVKKGIVGGARRVMHSTWVTIGNEEISWWTYKVLRL
jgi:hypothetical protein